MKHCFATNDYDDGVDIAMKVPFTCLPGTKRTKSLSSVPTLGVPRKQKLATYIWMDREQKCRREKGYDSRFLMKCMLTTQ